MPVVTCLEVRSGHAQDACKFRVYSWGLSRGSSCCGCVLREAFVGLSQVRVRGQWQIQLLAEWAQSISVVWNIWGSRGQRGCGKWSISRLVFWSEVRRWERVWSSVVLSKTEGVGGRVEKKNQFFILMIILYFYISIEKKPWKPMIWNLGRDRCGKRLSS